MKDRAHDDAMAEAFREDPAYAVDLLNSILEDGDQGELLIALRQMNATPSDDRKGGVPAFIEEAVRAYLLERAVDQAKMSTADMSVGEVNDLVAEAVQWAREH